MSLEVQPFHFAYELTHCWCLIGQAGSTVFIDDYGLIQPAAPVTYSEAAFAANAFAATTAAVGCGIEFMSHGIKSPQLEGFSFKGIIKVTNQLAELHGASEREVSILKSVDPRKHLHSVMFGWNFGVSLARRHGVAEWVQAGAKALSEGSLVVTPHFIHRVVFTTALPPWILPKSQAA